MGNHSSPILSHVFYLRLTPSLLQGQALIGLSHSGPSPLSSSYWIGDEHINPLEPVSVRRYVVRPSRRKLLPFSSTAAAGEMASSPWWCKRMRSPSTTVILCPWEKSLELSVKEEVSENLIWGMRDAKSWEANGELQNQVFPEYGLINSLYGGEREKKFFNKKINSLF